MSLYHQCCKHCYDKGYDPPNFEDFSTGIILVDEGKGPRIHKWPKSGYGNKPTLSQLPNDGVSVQWCKDEIKKTKINRQAWVDADSVEKLKALLLPDLEKSESFDDQV